MRYFKRGGIRFFRLGRLTISWSIKRATTSNHGKVLRSYKSDRCQSIRDMPSKTDHVTAQLRLERLCKRASGGF